MAGSGMTHNESSERTYKLVTDELDPHILFRTKRVTL